MSLLQKMVEQPESRKRLKRWSIAVLVLVVLAEVVPPLFSNEAHHHFGFEGFPAFGSLYGFLSCVAIIVISKLIGKLWLMRKEDHYDS